MNGLNRVSSSFESRRRKPCVTSGLVRGSARRARDPSGVGPATSRHGADKARRRGLDQTLLEISDLLPVLGEVQLRQRVERE